MRYYAHLLFLLATTVLAQQEGSQSSGGYPTDPQTSDVSSSGGCPSVWKDVASDLQNTFQGCGDAARGAIRAPFHDCVNGACDGSLILGGE